MSFWSQLLKLGLLAPGLQLASANGAAAGSVKAEDPSPLQIELVNNCDYPTRFLWDTNIGGPSPNVLAVYNKQLDARSSEAISLPGVTRAWGRIYLISAIDEDVDADWIPLPADRMLEALERLAASDVDGPDEVRQTYTEYLHGMEPAIATNGDEAAIGQLLEFTVAIDGGGKTYDADISNVDSFNEAVGLDMMFPFGYNKIDTANCRNTSNPTPPKKERCEGHGLVWVDYPQGASVGPPGMCKSLNSVCLRDYISHPVCSMFDADLTPLMDFLLAHASEIGYQPQLKDVPHTTRVYLCDGFLDNPTRGFMMASMCTAINRGQCPMPDAEHLVDLESFQKYTNEICGQAQFYGEGPESWFKHTVLNPWAQYTRATLGSTGYAFAQDEGPFGGNVQCRSDSALGWSAPESMRIVACPASTSPRAGNEKAILV